MKKTVKTLVFILCVACAFLLLTACSDYGAPSGENETPSYAVTPESTESKLEGFLTGHEDRTSFTQQETLAAEYLMGELLGYGYTDVALIDFKASEGGVSNLASQNVVATYAASDRTAETKNIILGAFYDNRYSKSYTGSPEYRAEAALTNGTGVATLLSVAEYLAANSVKLDFDVTIVFFGGGFVYDTGAREFYNNYLTGELRARTVLMTEFQRIGGDHIYAYTDARENRRSAVLTEVSKANGLDIYKPTAKSPQITTAYALDGIPFYQWAHSGLFTCFHDGGIPIVNIEGGNWEGLNFTDRESTEYANMSYSGDDDLKTLAARYPDYGKKMAAAATLMIRAMESDEFLPAVVYDRENFPDTSILNKQWVWELIVFSVMAIGLIVVMLVNARLMKKYPIVAPKPQRMKMAVFGMDYEDKNDADIFIDLKNSASDEIFPGVPNNDPKPRDNSLDDIFPPIFGAPPTDGAKKPRSDEPSETDKNESKEIVDEPTNGDVRAENTDDREPASAKGEEKRNETDGTGATGEDKLEKREPDKTEKATVKRAAKPTKPHESVTVEHKPIKRKTVSAGKKNGENKDGESNVKNQEPSDKQGE